MHKKVLGTLSLNTSLIVQCPNLCFYALLLQIKNYTLNPSPREEGNSTNIFTPDLLIEGEGWGKGMWRVKGTVA